MGHAIVRSIIRVVISLLFTSAFAQVSLTASPDKGLAPLTVTFQATCPTCVAYTWNFGDSGVTAIKSQTQTHIYQAPGLYTAIFAGVNSTGQTLIAQVNVAVGTGEDNRYCDDNNQWTGGASDGPAALPTACLNTAVANTPSPGLAVMVAPQKLQAAYNVAKCGQTLKLAHGQTWNGPFSFPSKNCDDKNWITIMSDGTLPAPGTRAQKTDAPQMARLYLKQGVTTWGDHIRFIGIEWAKQPGGIIFLFASLKGANKIIFDRNLVHGNPKEDAQHGIQVNTGKNIAVIESTLYEFHCTAVTGTCVDSQAISGGTGDAGAPVSKSGPVKIVNNYIEASTENILFGGAVADGVGPNDVEIRRNYLFKPQSWNPSDPSFIGVKYIVKNLLELKNGARILIEGNVLQNTWGGYTQKGAAVLFTPKNQAGANNANLCPNCAVLDTTFRYNYISTASAAIVTGSGPNDHGAYSQGQHRTSIHDDVADNLQYPTCYGCGVMLNELGSGYSATNPPPTASVLSNLSISNLTLIAVGTLCCVPGQPGVAALLQMSSVPPNALVPQATNISFTNTIASTQKNGLASTGGGTNNCMNVAPTPRVPKTQWPTCFIGASPFSGNVLVGYPGKTSDWPVGNQFATDFTGMFVNFNGGNGGDYHLVPNSPYQGKGADIDKVDAMTAGVK